MNNEQLREQVAKAIHYPQCWDPAAYPTLDDALREAGSDLRCSECQPSSAPAAVGVPEGWKLVPDYKVGMLVKFGGEEYKIFALGDRTGTFDICHPTDGPRRDRWVNVPPEQLEPLAAAPSAGNALPADLRVNNDNGTSKVREAAQPAAPDSAAAPVAIQNALQASLTVCERIIEQDGGILGGVDFNALKKAIDRARAAHQPPASDGDVPMPDDGEVLKFGSEIVQLATRFANNEIHSYQLASAVEKKLRAYGDARALAALASAGKPSGLDAIDAARYRWLRQHDIPDDAQDWISAGKFDDFGVDGLHGKELDDAIDAAMKGETA